MTVDIDCYNMTRDEIYDHLAQVYLGKRKEADSKKKRALSAWLVINALITVIIFSSAFYGLTAFFTQKDLLSPSNIVFSLHGGLVNLDYNFDDDFPPSKSFSLTVPPMDAAKYRSLRFSVRAKDGGNPGAVKVIVRSRKNEVSAYYIQGIVSDWQDYSIPFDQFKQISDWADLKDITFVLESWNMENKKGVLLIGDICFSS